MKPTRTVFITKLDESNILEPEEYLTKMRANTKSISALKKGIMLCTSKVVHNDDSLSLQPHHSSMLSGASTPVIVQEMQRQSDPKNMPKFDGNDLEYLEF